MYEPVESFDDPYPVWDDELGRAEEQKNRVYVQRCTKCGETDSYQTNPR